MPKYDNAKLINTETGEEIKQGAKVQTRRGEVTFLFVSRLPEGNSSGRVLTDEKIGGEYFPNVLGGKIQPPIEASEVGTWLDGHMGWHNAYRVINRAVEFGFKIPDEYKAVMDKYNSCGDDSGFEELLSEDERNSIHDQGELSDMASEWLYELAPKGHTFVWDAGELSLMTDEDAEMYNG